MFLPTRFSLSESEQSKHSRILVIQAPSTRPSGGPGLESSQEKKDRVRDRAGDKATRQVQSLSGRQDRRQGWRKRHLNIAQAVTKA